MFKAIKNFFAAIDTATPNQVLLAELKEKINEVESFMAFNGHRVSKDQYRSWVFISSRCHQDEMEMINSMRSDLQIRKIEFNIEEVEFFLEGLKNS